MNGTYDPYIKRLRNMLRGAGVIVTMAPLPGRVAGRYYESSKRIRIDESSAKRALLTLAHEAGHWFGYRINPGPETKKGKKNPRREREAITYGWRLLILVGADKVVTRADWADHHGMGELW